MVKQSCAWAVTITGCCQDVMGLHHRGGLSVRVWPAEDSGQMCSSMKVASWVLIIGSHQLRPTTEPFVLRHKCYVLCGVRKERGACAVLRAGSRGMHSN
jgi:hypothetical protein